MPFGVSIDFSIVLVFLPSPAEGYPDLGTSTFRSLSFGSHFVFSLLMQESRINVLQNILGRFIDSLPKACLLPSAQKVGKVWLISISRDSIRPLNHTCN